MPAGMLGLLLMPLGLDGPFFHLMTWGCEGVLWIARRTADLPGASVLVRQWPGTALALLAVGGLWLALWQRPWRWAGLAPVAAAVALAALARPPDLLVDPSLGMAALRGSDGTVTLVEWRRDRLIREFLAQAPGRRRGREGTGTGCRAAPRRGLRRTGLRGATGRGQGLTGEPGRSGGRGLPARRADHRPRRARALSRQLLCRPASLAQLRGHRHHRAWRPARGQDRGQQPRRLALEPSH